MSDIWFYVRWPNESRTRCLSRSPRVTSFFEPGGEYTVADLLRRSRYALTTASERVRCKQGDGGSAALEQVAKIEPFASQFADQPDAVMVMVEGFET